MNKNANYFFQDVICIEGRVIFQKNNMKISITTNKQHNTYVIMVYESTHTHTHTHTHTYLVEQALQERDQHHELRVGIIHEPALDGNPVGQLVAECLRGVVHYDGLSQVPP